MELEGKIKKHTKGGPPDWIVEVPALDLITQGYTRQEALDMLESAIVEYMEYYFEGEIPKDLVVSIEDSGKSKIGISCSHLSFFMSLILIKQREKAGTSIRDIAHRMGSNSPHAYKSYESGHINVSVGKFDQLIHAVNPKSPLRLRLS